MSGLTAAGLTAAGLTGAGFAGDGGTAGLVGVEDFFTERIALPGAGLAATAPFPVTGLPLFRRLRIRPASSSLIELLWLLAVIDNRSAASSTSLFSRPRSLDSS